MPTRVLAEETFNELAEVERRMLRGALELNDPTALQDLLLDYLAVRTRRMQRVPEQVRVNENELEALEGSAEFIGSYAEAFVSGIPAGSLAPRIADWFAGDLNDLLGEMSDLHWRHRGRVYGTGAALAVLLDRLGADWRSPLEQGRSFEEILAGVVGFDPVRDEARADEAIALFSGR